MKRSWEGARGDERGGGKRHQGSSQRERGYRDGYCAFKVLAPEALTSHLLTGRTPQVQTIQDSTGAHLNFSRRGEYFPDTELRILVISAAEARAVMAAIERIVDEVLQLADRSRDSEFKSRHGYKMFCALQKESAGGIIGSKGSHIQWLRKEFGIHINIKSDVVEGHQLVTLEGSRKQLVDVFGVLSDAVQKDIEAPWFPEWARQKAFGSGSGEAAKSSDSGRGHRVGSGGDDTIWVGALAQATRAVDLEKHFSQFGEVLEADVKIDKDTGRSKGFGFVAFAEPIAVDECLRCYDHRISGKEVQVKRYGTDGDAGKRDKWENDRGTWENDRGSDRSDEHGWQKDGRHGSGWNGKNDWADGGEGDANGDDPMELMTKLKAEFPGELRLNLQHALKFTIPTAKLEDLVGPDNQYFDQVEGRTGAQVMITEAGGSDEVEQYSSVEIQGPLLKMYCAHLMIMKKYHEKEAEEEEKQRQADRKSVV